MLFDEDVEVVEDPIIYQYTLEEYQQAVYNATKQAIEDVREEEQIEEAERNANITPTPAITPDAQRVIVDNFPQVQNVRVNNYSDIDYSDITDHIDNLNTEGDPDVEFSTSTDARLYTVGTSAPVSTATGQSAVYLLEIRNIVLIFCLLWFVVYIISMLKRTSKRFTKGDNR